jgi:hypothetical protein
VWSLKLLGKRKLLNEDELDDFFVTKKKSSHHSNLFTNIGPLQTGPEVYVLVILNIINISIFYMCSEDYMFLF